MASIFGHSVVGITISYLPGFRKLNRSTKWIGIVSTILPDLDVLAFRFGIPYTHMLGHRGITHSIFFAALYALIWKVILRRSKEKKWHQWFYIFLCTVSHGFLDALTNGGRGVALVAPFSAERFFLPWTPIQVSPLGINRFFSYWGLEVLKSELLYIGIPCTILFLTFQGLNWFNRKGISS